MAPAALIFDLDGTLWDGASWYARGLNHLSGAPRNATEARLAAGENVLTLARAYGVERKLYSWCETHTDLLTLYPDVVESLQELQARGLPLGLVTSLSPRIAARPFAEHSLDTYFNAHRFGARKPAPRSLLSVLTQLGLEASQNVTYVGDMEVDAIMAERAGVSFAWCAYGYGQTTPSYATAVLHSPVDLTSL